MVCRLVFAVLLVAMPWRLHAGETDAVAEQDEVIVQAVLRLDHFDLDSRPKAKAAVLRHLRRNPECDELITLVERFHLTEANDLLVHVAATHCDETKGVAAASLLVRGVSKGQVKRLLLDGNGPTFDRAALLTALGRTENGDVRRLAIELAGDAMTEPALRHAAIETAGRDIDGQVALLGLVQNGKIPQRLHRALGDVLLTSQSADVRDAAAEMLVLPKTSASEPLPPLATLTKMSGDAARGAAVFRGPGNCATCHQVGGSGKQVGPDLTEIGSKLAREAMFVSILDPSAAISFNYETHDVIRNDGRTLSGILVSKTDKHVVLRTAEAIDRTIEWSAIDEMSPQTTSMMPTGLVQNLTTQQLVDLVEYLMTLKKL